MGAEIPSLARGTKTDTETTQSPVWWRRGILGSDSGRALQKTWHVLQKIYSASGVDNRSVPPSLNSRCPATIISEFTNRIFKIISPTIIMEFSPQENQNIYICICILDVSETSLRQRLWYLIYGTVINNIVFYKNTALLNLHILLLFMYISSSSSSLHSTLFLITCFYFYVFRISWSSIFSHCLPISYLLLVLLHLSFSLFILIFIPHPLNYL
jgi:hypothetical protein